MSKPVSTEDPFGRKSSGDTSFRMTTADIVEEVLDICQVGVEEQDIEPEDYKRVTRSMNLVASTWQSQGIHLWTYQEGILFLEEGKGRYTLEQSFACNNDKYTLTNTTSDYSAGETVIQLEEITNTDNANETTTIDFGWIIGYCKSDGNIEWTTVDNADVNTITLTDALVEDVTTDTDFIFFEKRLSSVERMLDVRRLQNVFSQNQNETPINLMSHDAFMRLPTKTSKGTVNQCTYDRVLAQGVLRVWATPQNSQDQVTFTYERMIDNFVNVDDCADMPRYWLEAFCWNVADVIGVKYRVPPQLQQEIRARAQITKDEALAFDNANYELKTEINTY